MVNFRTEIETSFCPSHKETPFFLQVDLFFHEASDEELRDPKNIGLNMNDEALKKFYTVSSQTFKLNNVLKGLCEH